MIADERAVPVVSGTDVLRVVAWISANGMAGLLAGPVTSRAGLPVAAALFGLVLGLLQSAAVGRTWREALAWTALTAMAFVLVTLFAVMPLLLAAHAAFHEAWIGIGLLGLLVGAGTGLAQATVFLMRDAPRRVMFVWILGSAFAAAIVSALVFMGAPAGVLGEDSLSALYLHGVVSDDFTRAAYGLAFGVLTAPPFTAVLVEARAAER